jgi:hypothetical protein
MFGDIGKMLKIAGELKTRLPELQAKLEKARFTGQSSEGMVEAVVSGKGQLVDIQLSHTAVAQGDPAKLAGWIKEAVSSAQAQAAQAAAEGMREITGGMSLPGMEGILGS